VRGCGGGCDYFDIRLRSSIALQLAPRCLDGRPRVVRPGWLDRSGMLEPLNAESKEMVHLISLGGLKLFSFSFS